MGNSLSTVCGIGISWRTFAYYPAFRYEITAFALRLHRIIPHLLSRESRRFPNTLPFPKKLYYPCPARFLYYGGFALRHHSTFEGQSSVRYIFALAVACHAHVQAMPHALGWGVEIVESGVFSGVSICSSSIKYSFLTKCIHRYKPTFQGLYNYTINTKNKEKNMKRKIIKIDEDKCNGCA